MTTFRFLLAPVALALAAAMPALAASTAASSASSASSASIGSLSDSIQDSSQGSSRPARTAQGDYQVTAVAAVDGKPGMLRVTLVAADVGADADAGEGFDLLLPQKAAAAGGVAVGQVVHAAPRPYGVEFARADNREAFFLVLQDEWYRELASNPV